MSLLRGVDSSLVFINRWSNPVKERANLGAELCSEFELSRTIDGFITALPRWNNYTKGRSRQ